MTTYTQLAPPELRSALVPLLTQQQGRARPSARQLDAFAEFLLAASVGWEGLRLGPPGTPTALFFALRLPGRTAIVMIPALDTPGIDADAQLDITRAGLAGLRSHRFHYAQALLEPETGGRDALLRQVGFRFMAPLAYLERDALYPWSEPPADHEAEWVSYSADTHPLFADVIAGTYENTLDCPELSGLRPIEDVLASHRGSGRHEPELWGMARINNEPAGCMLLTWLTHAPCLDVVYMGVLPAFRGRGVGKLLLRWALQQCRAHRARRLTLVVDDRNTPAKRVYDEMHLRAVGRRDAYLYVWE
jgi:GNAT superfamily N-acetyltransferase